MEDMNRIIGCMKKRMLFIGMLTMLVISAGGFLVSCDNGDSVDAKLEDARIALDEGNYALAKSILETLPQTEEVLEYLSNAIAGGELNIDTLNIISTMDELGDEGREGSIDIIGKLIGNDNDELSCEDIDTKLAAVNEAIGLFEQIMELKPNGINDLTEGQKLQLGLLSMTRTVLVLAKLISNKYNSLSVDCAAIVMTEEWIKANRHLFATVDPTQDDLDSIDEDLHYISVAIDAVDEDNDMLDDYTTFKNELDTDHNDHITADEINNYIATM